MVKICLIRSCRIVLMLVVIALASFVAIFSSSPDISFVKAYFEQQIGLALHADSVDIQSVNMRWHAGPVFDIEDVNISSDAFSIHHSHITLSYSMPQLFRADAAPVLSLTGGIIAVNLDADIRDESKTSPVYITTKLKNVQINWTYQGETQKIYHADAEITPWTTSITLDAYGLALKTHWDSDGLPKKIELNITDFSYLPHTWLEHAQGMNNFKISIQRQAKSQWAWQSHVQADDGLLAFDEEDIRLPFDSLSAQGDIQLDISQGHVSLVAFEASDLQWKGGDNFGVFKALWQEDILHIEALDASTTMPLLWSWLRPIGGGLFHQWLVSMKHGRINQVRANVDLPWKTPLHTAPTLQNLLDMKYHVTAQAQDADIALGLEGDYLYHVVADVMVDELHLQAKISHAVLNEGLAVVAGDYHITWDTLLMDVNAEGQVDVGSLHAWLDPESAAPLVWGDAPAQVKLHLVWDLDENEPKDVVVGLEPVASQVWHIAPQGVPITIQSGEAVWDYQRGLDLKQMNITLPWLKGSLTAFIDKNKGWVLQDVRLDGYAALADLTETFALPIVNPQGLSKVQVIYDKGKWSGDLDLSANDWDNFIGFDKQGLETLHLPFVGHQVSSEILPIQIDAFKAEHKNFSLKSSIFIDENNINFSFQDIITPAFQGDMKLNMPLDEKLAWRIEVDAAYMDKPVLSKYLIGNDNIDVSQRPWSVAADIDKVVWERSYAENVHIRFASDRKSLGNIQVDRFFSQDTNLEKIKASFTLHDLGVYELHLFEARGSGQWLQASGSVQTQADGSLRWQGLALMEGKFGTLMKQAELDKLFQEGDMAALFLGHGEYKDGEPWWRDMKGSFKLRVNDGRIMEGGTLTHLLAAISLVDLPKYLIFDRGDVVGDGLLYNKLQVEGYFSSHQLNITQLGFLSSALDAGGKGEVNLKDGTMDIVLVARPWQNAEVAISEIPLLGSILTGEDKSILRKIYRIHGSASDAVVDEIDAAAAGLPKGGYLEDLFTPSRWFEPVRKIKEKQ